MVGSRCSGSEAIQPRCCKQPSKALEHGSCLSTFLHPHLLQLRHSPPRPPPCTPPLLCVFALVTLAPSTSEARILPHLLHEACPEPRQNLPLPSPSPTCLIFQGLQTSCLALWLSGQTSPFLFSRFPTTIPAIPPCSLCLGRSSGAERWMHPELGCTGSGPPGRGDGGPRGQRGHSQ